MSIAVEHLAGYPTETHSVGAHIAMDTAYRSSQHRGLECRQLEDSTE